jgi:TrmH family RNA methyltransferase
VRLIGDALVAGASPIRLFVVPDQLGRTAHGRALLRRTDGPETIEVTPAVLEALSDAETPQGAVAVFPMPEDAAVDQPGHIVLVLDGLQDPGNVGTILRSALACGLVECVIVRGGADPFGSKAVRAAASALFRLRVSQSDRLPPDRPIWVAEARGDHRYDELDWLTPCVLVIGSEARGPSAEVLGAATGRVSVPLRGPIESLNAGVAASILLFEAARQLDNARR